jgi:hypothetical protein
MNADGSNRRIISDTVIAKEWSPDGSKFAGSDLSSLGIFVINVDGSNLTFVTSHPYTGFNVTWDTDPAWSPDGSKIVFYRLLGCDSELTDCRSSQIWMVNADGGNPRNLTDESTGVFDYDPVWSPDGTKIVFARKGDLFVMNADGGGITNITGTENQAEFSPSWQTLSLNQPPSPNPIDDPRLFVGQHYLDFLGREPDAGGLAYWTNQITQCGNDAACIHRKRIDVSAAFFIEQEFQETGYYVYRFYQASFGRQPNYAEFTSDRSRVIGGSSLEANKQAFADDWVQRPAFLAAYANTMSNTEVVNKLFGMAGLTASTYDTQRQQEIQAMNAGRSRALVLRDVIEIPDFKNIPDATNRGTSQYNSAFVLMQYFGYLRRNVDPGGYAFWLDIVNNREPNNYRAMVCAFITSSEYQLRFGSAVTSTNQDCGQ